MIAAGAAFAATRRDIMLNDVEIEDGTVRIIYDENGAERRIEKINANLSLPHLVDPLTAKGDFDWKNTRVGFDLKLTTPADLESRSARLELALDTEAIDAKFDGNIMTQACLLRRRRPHGEVSVGALADRLDAQGAADRDRGRQRRAVEPYRLAAWRDHLHPGAFRADAMPPARARPW